MQAKEVLEKTGVLTADGPYLGIGVNVKYTDFIRAMML